MSHRRLCLILVELHKRRSDFHICVEISFKSSSRVVSNLGLNHMISIQLVAIATFCFATRNTLLDFSVAAQNEIGFPIRVGRFVFYPGVLMKG